MGQRTMLVVGIVEFEIVCLSVFVEFVVVVVVETYRYPH
jgi:hypothetical protein